MRIAITLSYDGSAYSGFAKQKDKSLRTVQGQLEAALDTALRTEIPLVCAGRTDAGVHALAQVVSCDVAPETDLRRLRLSLNALTDEDIAIKEIRQVSDDFSARFSADVRTYVYRIYMSETPPLFCRNFAWWHKGDLDIEEMKKASLHLIGEHDFKSFAKASSTQDKNTVRTIHSIEFFEEKVLGEDVLAIRFRGNAYLHSMIRTIVGSLVSVGQGKEKHSWIAAVLKAKNREVAGETAPACGLTFAEVTYK